jgi:nucleotide-binding universal stress UspA family protein
MRSSTERVSGSILCGVDGSDDARLALRAAARLSRELDLRLVVAHVVQTAVATPPGGLRFGATMTPHPRDELASGEALLDRVLAAEGLAGAERRVVYGFPPDSLADLADEEDAELIVVGSRGRGAFKAAFLGSVSSDLIGVARAPVLVVPPGAAGRVAGAVAAARSAP